jgi:hypothetical protein
MKKIIVAIRNFAKAPMNVQYIRVGVARRIMFKVTLKTLCRKVETGYFWRRTGTSSRLF